MVARDGSFELARTAGNRLEMDETGPSGGHRRHHRYWTVPYDRGDAMRWVVGVVGGTAGWNGGCSSWVVEGGLNEKVGRFEPRNISVRRTS